MNNLLLWIKDDKVRMQFTCSLALQQWYEATQMLQVQRVVAPRCFIPMTNNCTVQAVFPGRWGAHKFPQSSRIRNISL